jgi:group I intron endonuclease
MNVYCITFPNQKRYVGIEGKTGQRKWAHSNSEKNTNRKMLVCHAIRKYKWINCKFEYIVMDRPPEECYELEKKLIAEWGLQSRDKGYNQSSGGEKGFKGVKMAQEHKDKISKSNTGQKRSQETVEILRRINTGKKLTKEHKDKITEGLKIGKPKRFAGKKHKEESKKKTSEALMGEKNHFFGKIHTAESKAKMSFSRSGPKNYSFGKPAHNRRKILCITNNMVYVSLTEASKALGLHLSRISDVCRGGTKQTKGYSFRFLDENEQ